MDEQTEHTLRSLVGHAIVRVEIADDDAFELGVPDSEGWRLVISPVLGRDGTPELRARWEPGLPHYSPAGTLRRLVTRAAHLHSR